MLGSASTICSYRPSLVIERYFLFTTVSIENVKDETFTTERQDNKLHGN